MLLCCSQYGWWNSLQPGDQATWVLAALTLGYFVVTFFLWRTARKTLEESTKLFGVLNTPWIDITGIGYEKDHNGQGYRRILSVSYMNFGNIPATVLDGKIEFKVAGSLIEDTVQNPFEPDLIPKHEKVTAPFLLNNDELTSIIEKKAKLTLDIEIHYKGAGNEIKTYEQHSTFDPQKDRFVDNTHRKSQ